MQSRAFPFMLHVDLLAHGAKDLTALRKDGWRVRTSERADQFDVSHPLVQDEHAARLRLHRLGLLIASSLRIEFFQDQR